MRILLDCDGVLADFVKETIAAFDHQYRRENITDFNIMKAWGLPSSAWGKLETHFGQKGVVGNLEVMEGAKEMVEELKKLGDITIATSPMKSCPWWFSEREEWLNKHFGFSRDDIIFAGKKELIKGDILIDDAAHNIEAFVKNHRHDEDLVGILFDAPWNQKCEGAFDFVPGKVEGHVFRCRSGKEVVEAVKLAKEYFSL